MIAPAGAPGLPVPAPGPIAVVVNPAAGGGKAVRLVETAIHRNWKQVRLLMSRGPGEPRTLAAQAVRDGARLVLAVGGDGTLHDVVAGVLETDPTVPVGLVPAGTGVDAARNLGLPPVPRISTYFYDVTIQAVDVLEATWTGPDGREYREPVVNALDVGLGARVADRVNRAGGHGKAAFLQASLAEIRGARPLGLAVRVDGTMVHEGAAMLGMVANGRWAGGGMAFAPHALLDDGRLEVLVLEGTGRRDLAFRLLPAVYRGQHLTHPRVRTWSGSTAEIVPEQPPALAELDGEVRLVTGVRVRVLPGGLLVARPDA